MNFAAPDEPVFDLHRGQLPLLVSVPHAGTRLPEALRARLIERAWGVEDTDWHLDTLYGFTAELGASLLRPRFSRFVVDLNRPPDDAPMYPGANNTGLCPTRFFSGDPIYRPGAEPDPAEIAQRRAHWWQPYHATLAAELARLKALHGYALLWDGHSIRSELPWLFPGRLHDLNIGTADGASCAPSLRAAVAGCLADVTDFNHVIDGRFRGGYITRHYGRPDEDIHAVQLEMSFRCYMEEAPPFELDPSRRARLDPVLRALIGTLLAWRPAR